MFDIHLARHRGKIVAIADIGSASVAFAIVSLQPGAPAEVLAAERAVLSVEERTKEATITALGADLVQVGEKMTKAYAAKTKKAAPIEQLFCTVRAPWCRSTTVQARSKSEKSVAITQAMIGALAKRALADQTQLDVKNVLEASVVRVELDGYPTGMPVGKHSKLLEVTALASDCDPALRAEVQRSLETLFPHHACVFRSSTLAILSAIHERAGDENDYLVVDVVSEGTTLISVRDGAIVGQYFVPEGVRSILKRLAPTGMAEETLGALRMLERDQSSDTASDVIQTAMARAEPEMVRAFGEGMTACASVRRLPNKLILLAQADIAPWLAKFFSRIDFTQFTLTTRPFLVETLTPKELSQFVTSASGVSLDTGLALSVALVNREQGKL